MKSLLRKLGVILIGLLILGYGEARGADWKVYFYSKLGKSSYDAQNITGPSRNLVRVWVKQEYTLEGIIEMVDRFGADYQNLNESIILWELNCRSKEFCLLEATHYSKDGGILFTGKTKCEWDSIIVGTHFDFLYKAVCK